jgi:hypothetical protein
MPGLFVDIVLDPFVPVLHVRPIPHVVGMVGRQRHGRHCHGTLRRIFVQQKGTGRDPFTAAVIDRPISFTCRVLRSCGVALKP